MSNNNLSSERTFHEYLKDSIKFESVIYSFAVELFSINKEREEMAKVLFIDEKKLKNGELDDDKFFPQKSYSLSNSNNIERDFNKGEKRALIRKKTILNLFNREFDDVLYTMFLRKNLLLNDNENSSIYILKISDFKAIFDKEKSNTSVRIRIYVSLKRKILQNDINESSFNTVVVITAYITPLREYGAEQGIETMLRLTEKNSDKIKFFYEKSGSSKVLLEDLTLQDLMLKEFEDNFLKNLELDKNYKIEEITNFYKTYIIHLDSSSFKGLFYNSLEQIQTLSTNNPSLAGKLVTLKYYITYLYNLYNGNSVIDWNSAPSSFSYFNVFLKKDINEIFGVPTLKTTQGPWEITIHLSELIISIIDSELIISIQDSESETSNMNISENKVIRIKDSIDQFYSKCEKDWDYNIGGIQWYASWYILINSLICPQELIFQKYLKNLSSSKKEANIIADLLEDAIKDFEEFYYIEIFKKFGRRYLIEEFSAVKKINNINKYYKALKEKRDMFAIKPFSQLTQLLSEQKTILNEISKTENEQKTIIGRLHRTETLMFFTTIVLLGATILLVFETMGTIWSSKINIMSNEILALFIMILLIFIVIFLWRKVKKYLKNQKEIN